MESFLENYPDIRCLKSTSLFFCTLNIIDKTIENYNQAIYKELIASLNLDLKLILKYIPWSSFSAPKSLIVFGLIVMYKFYKANINTLLNERLYYTQLCAVDYYLSYNPSPRELEVLSSIVKSSLIVYYHQSDKIVCLSQKVLIERDPIDEYLLRFLDVPDDCPIFTNKAQMYLKCIDQKATHELIKRYIQSGRRDQLLTRARGFGSSVADSQITIIVLDDSIQGLIDSGRITSVDPGHYGFSFYENGHNYIIIPPDIPKEDELDTVEHENTHASAGNHTNFDAPVAFKEAFTEMKIKSTYARVVCMTACFLTLNQQLIDDLWHSYFSNSEFIPCFKDMHKSLGSKKVLNLLYSDPSYELPKNVNRLSLHFRTFDYPLGEVVNLGLIDASLAKQIICVAEDPEVYDNNDIFNQFEKLITYWCFLMIANRDKQGVVSELLYNINDLIGYYNKIKNLFLGRLDESNFESILCDQLEIYEEWYGDYDLSDLLGKSVFDYFREQLIKTIQ